MISSKYIDKNLKSAKTKRCSSMIGNINKIKILILLLAATILSGCVSQDESSSATPSGNASHRIKVAATVAPLGDFVKAVGGEKVEVTVIVPPGAEPHTFEPTPSLMMDVARADLYVMNGAGLEFWMDKLLQANKEMIVVDSSQGIDLLQESEDEQETDRRLGDQEQNGTARRHAADHPPVEKAQPCGGGGDQSRRKQRTQMCMPLNHNSGVRNPESGVRSRSRPCAFP